MYLETDTMKIPAYKIRKTGLKPVFLVLPLIFLGIFYFYPVIKIILVSFSDTTFSTTAPLKQIFLKSSYLRVLGFTFFQAFISSILTLLVALPCTYVFVTYRFPGKSFLNAFATVPFVLPTVVVASAFNALLGNDGVINSILAKVTGSLLQMPDLNHTLIIIVAAHVFFNFAVIFRIVGGFWSEAGGSIEEAAAVLGATPAETFMKITLPIILPSIYASMLLVFVFCFSSFGVIMILGGPMFSTIEVEIYRQAVHLFNLPMAASLSVLQIVFTFLIMWIYTELQRRSSIRLIEKKVNIEKTPCSGRAKCLVLIVCVSMIVFIISPLFALIYKSVIADHGLTIQFYKGLFVNRTDSIFFMPPLNAIMNSLGFAGITLLISLIIGISASLYLAESKGIQLKIMDPLFMLPLSTSAVTLGFGFIIALDSPPLNLRNSLLLIPLAHSLVAFPFVVRAVLPALRSIPASLKEAAIMLGASRVTVTGKIMLPLIQRSIIVGAVFALTISIGEFGATMFVAKPQLPTMPLAIYRLLEQPGAENYGQAMAMSSILMIVTAAGFLVIEKLGINNRNEFA